jgi:hypothetical protein
MMAATFTSCMQAISSLKDLISVGAIGSASG